MKSGTRDEAEGKLHKVKGKIKEIAGKAVGNRDLEAEGKAENVDGKVQEKIGEIKARRWEVNIDACQKQFDGIRKGVHHALDNICYSAGFVGIGIIDRLHHGRRHSCPAGDRHHRGADPGASRTKTGVTHRSYAGQMQYTREGAAMNRSIQQGIGGARRSPTVLG